MSLSPEELDSLRRPLLDGIRTLQGAESGSSPPAATSLGLERSPGAVGRAWPVVPEELVDKLLRYTAELFRFNEKLGLVEASPREFVHAHLLDSLSPVAFLPESTRRRLSEGSMAVDLGSGAGLPGIPLALAFPELEMTLLDRSGRRCGFLRNAVAILGRRDITVLQGTLKEGGRRLAGKVELLFARAFHPLEASLYEALAGLLSPSGEMILYKGRREQAESELSGLERELRENGKQLPESTVLEVGVPGLERERSVLVMRFRSGSGGSSEDLG